MAEYEETVDGVTYRLFAEEDDVPVRGNASAHGDDYDREIEDGILRRLGRGDVWAWAQTMVEARAEGVESCTGHAYLGGCCYADAEDFVRCNWEDMKSEARADLIRELEDVIDRGERAEKALARLRKGESND